MLLVLLNPCRHQAARGQPAAAVQQERGGHRAVAVRGRRSPGLRRLRQRPDQRAEPAEEAGAAGGRRRCSPGTRVQSCRSDAHPHGLTQQSHLLHGLEAPPTETQVPLINVLKYRIPQIIFIYTDRHDPGAHITYSRQRGALQATGAMCCSCTTDNEFKHQLKDT